MNGKLSARRPTTLLPAKARNSRGRKDWNGPLRRQLGDLSLAQDIQTPNTRSATLYRMVLPEHTCPFGVRAKELLKRHGYDVDDQVLASRAAVDAFEAKQGVETTPQILSKAAALVAATNSSDISPEATANHPSLPQRSHPRGSALPVMGRARAPPAEIGTVPGNGLLSGSLIGDGPLALPH
jgi:glutaredoxin 3